MARPIFDVLAQSRGSAAVHDASKLLNELAKVVKETGKAGTLTIKLTIKPDKTDNTVVMVDADVTTKMPKKPYPTSIFYVDDRTGDLTREDPRQLELLREREADLKEQGAIALNQVGRGTG